MITMTVADPKINSSSVTFGNKFIIASMIWLNMGILIFLFITSLNGVVKVSIIVENVGNMVFVHRFTKNSKLNISASAKESDYCEGK